MAQLDSGIIMRGDSENLPCEESDGQFPSEPLTLSTLGSPRTFQCRQLGSESSPSSSVYYSLRSDRLLQMRREFSTDLEFEIESSKVHWSQLSSMTADAVKKVDFLIKERVLMTKPNERKAEWVQLFSTSRTKDDVAKLETFLWDRLRHRWSFFFVSTHWHVGRKIAEGGQAEIYTAIPTNAEEKFQWDRYVFKVFKNNVSLQGIIMQLERKVITGYCTTYTCPIWSAGYLTTSEYVGSDFEGRFAFRMQRYWGDLRKLLDLRMERGCNRNCPPLSYSEAIRSMLFIAKGMLDLHNVGILHRDLKASNVFVEFTYDPERATRIQHCVSYNGRCNIDIFKDAFDCRVGDFECSAGVVGTGFWRAPEILLGLKNRNVAPDLFTQKSDVYSFGMTCYEILTGNIPFENIGASNYDFVIRGARPKYTEQVDSWIGAMLEQCWHTNPLERPSFQKLCDILEYHM